MSSFVTSFWKSGMESQKDRDAKMRLRVAEASINAQRVAGEMKEPESIVSEEFSSATLHFSNHRGMNLVNDRPIYGAVHADLKHTDAGTCGTYMAAQYYATETKKRRDELLAKYAAA